MQWFDIGVNLLDKRFDAAAVIARASECSVTYMCMISSDINQSFQAQALAHSHNHHSAYQQLVYTAGIHPHYADQFSIDTLTQLKSLMNDKNMVAIGECGLDFNRNFSTQENQLAAFEAQLALAAEYNKPIYLHERDAFESQVALLKDYLPRIPKAIVHCFTGNTAQLDVYLSLGCYIGVTGWVCDDKRGKDLQEAVKHVPLDRLLLETDAPYLFPKTLRPRQKNNEPCFLPHVANKVSELKSIDLDILAEASLQNAIKVFGISELNASN
jgi:TatD DNase family protein